ncbi:MAG: response regulator [Pseudomonadota bacterium]|nr:MAG: response regulator [Pseudomonadota bacterium]
MNRTLLLIEDNEQNRYLVTYLLQARGWTVEHAADGASGIARAQELRPALVLLDIQLPGMDGYTVAQELRQKPVLANTPIIAVTSYAMPGDRERCLRAGCSGYIEKPIDPDTFVDAVESHLEAPT